MRCPPKLNSEGRKLIPHSFPDVILHGSCVSRARPDFSDFLLLGKQSSPLNDCDGSTPV